MAMRTERIRLGITVTPLSRRRPWKLAREAVTLDHLSNGHVIVGVGLGNGADADFAGLGEITDTKQRAAIVDESLDVIAGLWSGQPFSYEGQHFHLRDVTFLPTPVQQPRIPIWVGVDGRLRGRRGARCAGMVAVCTSIPSGNGKTGRPTTCERCVPKPKRSAPRPHHSTLWLVGAHVVKILTRNGRTYGRWRKRAQPGMGNSLNQEPTLQQLTSA